MKIGGSFHKDLEKSLKSSSFKIVFEKEKARLNLTAQLRETMERSQLSIRTVASRMKTSKSQIQRLISDDSANIEVDTLVRFAAAVGCKLQISFIQ